MTRTIFIGTAEAARICEYTSPNAFLRNLDRLIRDHGFPSPAPFGMRGYRWRRTAVEAWIESFGRPEDEEPADHQERRVAAGLASGKVALLQEARRL